MNPVRSIASRHISHATPNYGGPAAAAPQQGGLGPVGLPTPRASNAARRWLETADVTPTGRTESADSWLTMRGLRPRCGFVVRKVRRGEVFCLLVHRLG